MTDTDIQTLRHALHKSPGLSGNETFAHDLIVEQLTQCSPTLLFSHVGGYGVMAFWGDASEPCVALRADTDALPIDETLPIGYGSQVRGVSHKCGHDGHTATLLRVAQMISQSGTRQALLIFQPEEETGLGAQKMIDSGLLQQFRIKKIVGMHNLPGFPLGQVVLSKSTFAAASTGIVFRLRGRQTHASTPEKGLNPGLCVARIIQQMAELNSMPEAGIKSFRQTTLICVQLGAEAFGTSAGEASVMFTLRAFTNTGMQTLTQTAIEIANAAAAHYGLQVSHEWREPFRATENQATFVEQIGSRLSLRGFDIRFVEQPFRWSEDFSNYLSHYDGALIGIGAGTNQPELHHPDYDFPDELLEPAADVLMEIVRLVNCEF